MKTKLWQKYKGTFIGNVIVVAGGTSIGQIINIIFLPIITRLYGPETYGVLNLFLSVVTIIASIATLSYSYSIVLPKRDVVAFRLLRISVLLACTISITSGLMVSILKDPIVELFNLEEIASFLWLIPISVFLVAMAQSFEQWNIRNKQYKAISLATISKATLTSGVRTGLGLLMPTAITLVIVGIIAQAIQVLILSLDFLYNLQDSKVFKRVKHRDLKVLCATIKNYNDFPLYRAPQIFFNTISRSTPLIILASLFNPAVAGFYAIAQSLLYLPVNLISQSVGKVFLQRIANQSHSNKPIRPLVIRATYMLALTGIIPFGAVVIIGPWLFAICFGEEWIEAGNYARWLSIWVFFHFINVPTVQSFAFTKSQGILLGWEIVTTTVKILIILAVGTMTHDAELTVAAYAVFGAVAYIALIYIGIIRVTTYDNTK